MAEPVKEAGTISITVPADEFSKAERIASEENRPVGEVVASAINLLAEARLLRQMEQVWGEASTRNPAGYSDDDVVRISREVRSEMACERAKAPTAKAS